MADYHPIKKQCLFSYPNWFVSTPSRKRERKSLKMLLLCVFCSAHWPFAFRIIYPCLEDVFKLRFYSQLCRNYGNPENSSQSSWETTSFMWFFFFFFKTKSQALYTSEWSQKTCWTSRLHPPSLQHLLPAHVGSSPVVPSHGTGTILLCGSPAGPGQGRHLLPCCFEAVRNKESVVKQPCTFRHQQGTGMQPCLWPWKEHVVLYINGHNQAEESLLCHMFSLNMGLTMTIFTS